MLTIGHVLKALSDLDGDNVLMSKSIADVVIDSRKVSNDSLFVALTDGKEDGHNYVRHAFDSGAVAVIVDRVDLSGFAYLDLTDVNLLREQIKNVTLPVCLLVTDTLQALQDFARYWRDHLEVNVVGITGSIGKTTTKELTASVLSKRFVTLKSEGNFNNEIGLPLSVLGLNNKHEFAVLEMGFYKKGEIDFLCGIAKPQIGVITNVYPVHVERAGSLENIVAGKAELVQALPAVPHGTAILNADESLVMTMADLTDAKVFTYGLNTEADLWASNIHSNGLQGIKFQLHYRDEILHVRVPLLGRHSVHTALRAAAVGLVAGLSWQEILEGLQAQDGQAQLRLYAVEGPRGSVIIDDSYNASPESTIAALNLLDDLVDVRRIAVLGDMLELGSFEYQGHVSVGARARDVVDLLITVGDLGSLIAKGAIEAGMSQKAIVQCQDRKHALEYLATYTDDRDVILIKGSRSLGLDKLVAELEYAA
ncbi:MAG TPA: UDP-N-acetylmuramoylalanyl-D-glutamyl-2, 6-diaminopimelate--D-alanyl-D-alanine ligase [Chloroflexi bacterium]|nr:UDP-N-acetylmuramoylalanyl-D-glutamyl-2, 6-diaminopimelate--D-alanyl-D-alanine ligase [Chloroflexota bacterium]|tara:strand:+ start:2174 stop:3613 length:1440 start_codon:yes stop_codon:yes gene_type:complete